MKGAGVLARMEALIEGSGVTPCIEALLAIGVRPRQLSVPSRPGRRSRPARRCSSPAPSTSTSTTADDGGYWLIGQDGGIFAFGDAGFVGSLPGLGVHVDNIVGAVPTGG